MNPRRWLSAVLCIIGLAQAAPLAARYVWWASGAQLTRVSLEGGSVASVALDSAATAIEPDHEGGAWVRVGTRLLRIETDLTVAHAFEQSESGQKAGSLVWEPGEDRLWLSEGSVVRAIDRAGHTVAAMDVASPVRGFAVLGPRAILVASDAFLLKFDDTGRLLQSEPQPARSPSDELLGLVADRLRGRLWLVSRRFAVPIAADTLVPQQAPIPLSSYASAIAVDHRTGTVLEQIAGTWIPVGMQALGSSQGGVAQSNPAEAVIELAREHSLTRAERAVEPPVALPRARIAPGQQLSIRPRQSVQLSLESIALGARVAQAVELHVAPQLTCDGTDCANASWLESHVGMETETISPAANATVLADRDEQGRFVVRVPWNESTTSVGLSLALEDAFGNRSESRYVELSLDETGHPAIVRNRLKVAPTVSITSPANNAVFVAPATISIQATASDSDGTVTKVEFYRGTTLLSTDTTAPYSYNWTNVAVGTYSLTAKAFDNSGATTTSAPINVQVNANVAPTVTMTSPANGAAYTAPATVPLAATAADTDGTITKVEFYRGGTTKIATVTTPPYSYSWTNVAGGSYSLTAKATDDKGAVTTSAAVSIAVNAPPTVSITAPANNATFVAPSNITITASASDPGGSVAKVEFFNGTTLLATDTTSPYSYVWNNVGVGSYILKARATDNLGAIKDSTPISIVVNPNQAPSVTLTIPSSGSTFVAPASIAMAATASDVDGSISRVEFFRDATLLGSDATSPYSYTWNNVGVGTYQLSGKATDNKGAVTQSAPVSVTVNPNQPPTVALTSSPAPGPVLTATPVPIRLIASPVDVDGTINRVRFYVWDDVAEAYTLIGTVTQAPWEFTWTPPAVQTYAFYADARDNSGAIVDSDSIWVELVAPVPPTASVAAPADQARFIAPATVVLVAKAKDPDSLGFPSERIASVEFLDGATVLATMTMPNGASGEYAWVWRNAPIGAHSITARATDLSGASTQTAPMTIVVRAAASRPTVSLTQPQNGAVWHSGASPTVSASVSGAGSAIARVDFMNSAGALIGSASAAPYQTTWTGAPAGKHSITAHAVDVEGNVTVSNSAFVEVRATVQAPIVVFKSPLAVNSAPWGIPATLEADVASPDSPITLVRFLYGGTNLIGSATTPPYRTTWTSPPLGTWSVTAEATNLAGYTTTSSPVSLVFTGTNVPPSASMVSPSPGAAYAAPATIPLEATASDTDGTISKVEFFAGSTLIATKTSAPYTATWTGVSAGQHVLTARATDNSNSRTVSTPVTVTVNGAATVTIAAPASGAQFAAGQTVSVTATATLPGRLVSRVEFYADDVIVGTVNFGGAASAVTATLNWGAASVGNHSVLARAIATDLTSVDSLPVSIGVVDLAIALRAPYPWQAYIAPASVFIVAAPSTTGPAIARVEFLGDGVVIGQKTAPPYEYEWTGVAIGVHTVAARVVDAVGTAVVSPAAPVNVIAAPIMTLNNAANTSVDDDVVSVSGTLVAGANAGVLINGRLVTVNQDGTFVLDDVPLQPGANTITIIASDMDSAAITQTLTVNSTAVKAFQVLLDPYEGTAPLTATLTIRNRGNANFTRITIDTTGDGAPDATLTTLTNGEAVFTIPYSTPGTYDVTVKAYGPGDVLLYQALRRVRVVDPRNIGYRIHSTYTTMVNRLRSGNTAAALRAFTGAAQSKFSGIFSALGAGVAQAATELGDPRTLSIMGGLAEITLVRQTATGPAAYFVQFVLGEDGVWRIEEM